MPDKTQRTSKGGRKQACVALAIALACMFVALVAPVYPSNAANFEDLSSDLKLIDGTLNSDGTPNVELNTDKIDRARIPCHVRMTGPIETGDLEKLKVALQRVVAGRPSTDTVNSTRGLCLDSPGGSYAEAIRIAKAMLAKDEDVNAWPPQGAASLYTVIEAGAECYSACAIVFMAGNEIEWNEGAYIVTHRFLHAEGKLGFHSPYIDELALRGESFSKATVLAAHRAAVDAVRELAELGRGVDTGRWNHNIMPQELIVEMLARGPDDGLFLIDTVKKSVRFGVQLFGVRMPKRIGLVQLCNACINRLYAKDEAVGVSCSNSGRPIERGQRANRQLWFPNFGGEGVYYCVIKLSRGASQRPSIYNGFAYLDEKILDFNFTRLSAVELYSGNAPISELPQ